MVRKRHSDEDILQLLREVELHLAIDSVHDRLSSGRAYKMLTVLDAYTREALCVVVALKDGRG
jgi:putative transposase